MIENNRIKFGYGSVSVGCNPLDRVIIFQQIEPPKKCGELVHPGDASFIGVSVRIRIDYDDYLEFMKLLNHIEDNHITVFTFKDYIFDFTNYNAESIKVCRKHATGAIHLYLHALAC